MPELIDSVADSITTGFAFPAERRAKPRASSVAEFPEDFESFTIPSRGIVIAVLISGLLWAAIIFGSRALWHLIR